MRALTAMAAMVTGAALCCVITACDSDEAAGASDVLDTAGGDTGGAQADATADADAVTDSGLILDGGLELPQPADTGGPDDATAGDTASDAVSAGPLGGDRPAAVTLPQSYSDDQPWPLIILLHGYSVSGAIQDGYLGFSDAADAAGFIAVVPDGTTNPSGLRFWNADPAWCCNWFGSTVDDAAYILGLIAEARGRYNVAADRVYLMGHSNGGFMAYKMACEHADVIAGVIAIAGSSVQDPGQCQPSAPVSVLQVHGTSDTVIAYNGTTNGFPGAQTLVERWAGLNDCEPSTLPVGPLDYSTLPGDETSGILYDDCARGTLVGLWTLNGVGHAPLFKPSFMPAALGFLLNHQRQPAP